MKHAIMIVVALWATDACVFAGVGTIRGTEQDLWKTHCVVYAKVLWTRQTPEKRSQVTLGLDVTATLTGAFDAVASSRVTAVLDSGPESAIAAYPQTGSHVVALLRQGREDVYLIPHSKVLFMPNRAAIVTVVGFEDPRVQHVVKALRLLRGVKDDRAYKIRDFLEEKLKESEHQKDGEHQEEK